MKLIMNYFNEIEKWNETIIAIESNTGINQDEVCLFLNDLHLQDSGYEIIYAIDFSELFRYINPTLDRTILKSREKYYNEQMGIIYLLDKMKPRVLLLEPYYREFREHIKKIRMYFLEIAAQDPVALSQLLKNTKDSMKNTMYSEPEDLLRNMNENRLALFVNTIIDKHLTVAMKKFQKLLDDDILVSAKKYQEEAVLDIESSSKQEEDYKEMFLNFSQMRPRRHIPNRNDAEAAVIIMNLNNYYVKESKIFVLISNSFVMRKILGNSFIQGLSKDDCKYCDQVPILRSSYYFLLHLNYIEEKKKFLEEAEKYSRHLRNYHNNLKDFNFLALQRKYVSQSRSYDREYLGALENKIKKYFEDAKVAYQELLKLLGQYQKLPFTQPLGSLRKKVLNYIDSISDEFYDMLSSIDSVRATIKKPDELRKKVTSIVDEIGKYEVALSEGMFKFKTSENDINRKEREQKNITVRSIELVYDIKRYKKWTDNYSNEVQKILGLIRSGDEPSLDYALDLAIVLQSSEDYHKYPETNILLAKIYRYKRVNGEAEKEIENASKMAPKYSEVFFERGLLYKSKAMNITSKSRQKTETIILATQEMKKAIEMEKNEIKYYKEAAYLYWWLQDPLGGDATTEKKEHIKNAFDMIKYAYDHNKDDSDKPLIVGILNTYAYLLAVRSKEISKDEPELAEKYLKSAEEMIYEAIELINSDLNSINNFEKIDSKYETIAKVLLTKYESKKEKTLLHSAMSHLITALEYNPHNKWALKTLGEVNKEYKES